MGGGLAFCDGTIQSNVIAGNAADDSGGGAARCDARILNNTFCENGAGLNGGGLYSCIATISSCIFWANAAAGLGNQVYDSPNPSFSCIAAWTGGGTGNISGPPGFVSLKDPDYHLLAGSPCVDTGDNSAITPPGVDMAGNLRIAFGERSLTVDMGAYEYNSPPFTVSELLSDTSSRLRLVWKSQPNDTYVIWVCPDLPTGVWIREKATVPSQGGSTSTILPMPAARMTFYRVTMR